MSKFEELKHGKYTIKVGPGPSGKDYGYAFFLTGSSKWLGNGKAQGRDEAVEAAKSEIAKLAKSKQEARVNGIPNAEEFAEALEALDKKIHDGMWAMLKSHRAAPNMMLTSRQLGAAAGYQDYSGANRHYGELGKLLAQHLEFDPPAKYQRDGSPIWLSAIVEDTPGSEGYRDDSGEWLHTLRKEVAEAIDLLNARGLK